MFYMGQICYESPLKSFILFMNVALKHSKYRSEKILYLSKCILFDFDPLKTKIHRKLNWELFVFKWPKSTIWDLKIISGKYTRHKNMNVTIITMQWPLARWALYKKLRCSLNIYIAKYMSIRIEPSIEMYCFMRFTLILTSMIYEIHLQWICDMYWTYTYDCNRCPVNTLLLFFFNYLGYAMYIQK